MKNKVLVKFIVLELNVSFDAFIPVNEVVWKIKRLAMKSISDLSNNKEINERNMVMLNKDNSRIYDSNEIIIDTDIRNGTELILISIPNIM